MAVVTISREYGSGGNQVAGLVRDRLDYQFFDKNLMAQLGAETGLLSKADRDAVGEEPHLPSLIERFFAGFQPHEDPAAPTYGARSDAYKQLSPELTQRLIMAAFARGNVVLVGRGGQIVLHEKPDAFHVRVVAPIETRIGRVAQWEGVTLDVARDLAHQRDRAAADYIRHTYGADIADPSLYDLIISTGKLTPETAASLVVEAVERLTES